MSDSAENEEIQEEGVQPELEPTQTEEEEYKAKWQRALAELENQRKRFAAEREAASKYSLSEFLEELLPIVDNFDRATAHVPEEQQGTPWVTGIQYIRKQLLDALEARGVTQLAIKPGDAFDPTRHEGIGTEPADGMAEDRIIRVQAGGYLLHDRVLRPAQVIVSAHHTDK